jgi:hypothetical protein
VTGRAARRLAWATWGLALVILGGGSLFTVLVQTTPGRHYGVAYGNIPLMLSLAMAFSTVGLVIARRYPGNRLGWLFLWEGVGWALIGAYQPVAVYGLLVHPGSLPGLADVAAWLDVWLFIPLIGLIGTFLLLLFPDGRLPSPRWRPVAWCAGIMIVLGAVVGAFTPGKLSDIPQLRNPFGVEAFSSFAPAAYGFMFLLFVVAVVGSAASLVQRFRRARGEERLQLKWLVYAAVSAAVILPLSFSLWDLFTPVRLFQLIPVVGLPVAAGVAILKYRLYDIDVIINKTLVYGLLTVVLGAVYASLAVGLGSVAGRDNSVVIAGSTLVVAALFRPVRRRVQEVIDRRFYRRRYDAARTLEAFTARLRDEVDLDELRAHLEAVVRETMQPAQASLWLRPTERMR